MPHPDGQKEHLWIVIAKLDCQVAVVNLNTKRDGSDTTTVLNPGCHPFVRHPTVVTYADAMIVQEDQLVGLSGTDLLTVREECSSNMLRDIVDGVDRSKFSPMKIRKFCKKAESSATDSDPADGQF